MENFKHEKKEIHFRPITGEVISTNKYSETHVSSSGGGGYVSKHGGHVSAPQVHSHVTVNNEFWLRLKDGTEKSFSVTGKNIRIREGQKVTMLVADVVDENKPHYIALINHAGNEHWYLNSAKEFNQKVGFNTLSLGALLGIIMIWIFLFMFLGNPIFVAIATVFIIAKIVMKLSSVSKMVEKLDLHIEKNIQSLYVSDAK